jgi:hypothetical protein
MPRWTKSELDALSDLVARHGHESIVEKMDGLTKAQRRARGRPKKHGEGYEGAIWANLELRRERNGGRPRSLEQAILALRKDVTAIKLPLINRLRGLYYEAVKRMRDDPAYGRFARATLDDLRSLATDGKRPVTWRRFRPKDWRTTS